MVYLKPLLLRIVILAEQSLHQTPEKQPEITSDHVYQVLALRGEDHPGSTVISYIRRLVRKAKDDEDGEGDEPEENAESGMSSVKRTKLATYVDPSGKMAWWQMPLAQPDGPIKEAEGVDDDASSTMSDQEDAQLDEAMDTLDQADDESYEGGLWRAIEAEVPDEGVPLRERGSKRKQSLEADDDNEGDEIGPSRAAFIELQSEIGKARRHRHALRLRSMKAFNGDLHSEEKKHDPRRAGTRSKVLSAAIISSESGSCDDGDSSIDGGEYEEGESEVSDYE